MLKKDLMIFDVNTSRFAVGTLSLVLSPPGCGKSSYIREALEQPGVHLDLLGRTGLKLFVFAGGSNSARSMNLDRNVFDEVHFPEESLGNYAPLSSKMLKKSQGQHTYCVVLDDYVTESAKDMEVLRKMALVHKRHQNMIIIVAMHQLRLDKTGTTYLLLDNADRVYFCKNRRNIMNIESFLQRRGVNTNIKQAIFNDVDKDTGFKMIMFDAQNCLLVMDAKSLESGGSVVSCYGKKLKE